LRCIHKVSLFAVISLTSFRVSSIWKILKSDRYGDHCPILTCLSSKVEIAIQPKIVIASTIQASDLGRNLAIAKILPTAIASTIQASDRDRSPAIAKILPIAIAVAAQLQLVALELLPH
jgi:hypothetical protein